MFIAGVIRPRGAAAVAVSGALALTGCTGSDATAPPAVTPPTIGPSAALIAFVCPRPLDPLGAVVYGRLCLVSADSGASRTVLPDSLDQVATNPVWLGPDRLAVLVVIGSGLRLYTVGPDGRGLTRVAFPDSLAMTNNVVFGLTASPDGRSLAYGAYLADGARTRETIRVLDLTTGRTTTVGSGTNPAWSPDGRQIAFGGPSLAPSLLYDMLYLVNADGTNLQPFKFRSGGYAPAWSPDGSRLAYTKEYGEAHAPTPLVVARVADPGDPVQETWLTSGSDLEHDATWAPEGDRLAFTRTSLTYVSSILVVGADGTGAHVIAVGSGPRWRP